MSVRRQITEQDGVYFITFTCANWLPLLADDYNVGYRWFDHLKSNGHYIVGYVIMPNHIHAIIAFRNTGKSINSIVSNGKRFMAYEIIKHLQQKKEEKTLQLLKSYLNTTEIKEGKLHKVFETSFDWKECRTDNFLIQKLNYIHWNPCKVGLCKLPEEYEHSSAEYYVTGEHGVYKVTSYMELEDVDLTAPR